MPKKAFKKKKRYQAHCKQQAQAGRINNADGSWGPRTGINSMVRDYSPQRGGK